MERILIVDDEPGIRLLFKKILEAPERTISVEGSVQAAKARIASEPPFDVALLDRVLGDGFGADIARYLRERGDRCEFIFLTAHATLDSAVEALREGAFDFLAKPLDNDDALRIKVQSALAKAKLEQEQAALRQELEASEARYRKLFETASDAIMVVDPVTQRIEQANAAALFLYGYDQATLCNLRFADLLANGARTLIPRDNAVEKHRRSSGSFVWVEVACGSLTLQGRELLQTVARDVNERVRQEHLNATQQAESNEQAKMEALGKLASGVAHDFKNLLFVIHSYAHFLLTSFDDDDPRKTEADQIRSACDKAITLAQQLLAFGRKKPVGKTRINLNALVVGVRDLLRGSVTERITFETDLDSNLCDIKGEPGEIERVLLNLVINARDAIEGDGAIRITTLTQSVGNEHAESMGIKPGTYATLEVADNGCGMIPEVVAKVFEPFFTTKQGRGTGMGLATSYSIVRSMGGHIGVESSQSTGSVFRIHLPESVGTDQAQEAPASQPKIPQRPAGTVLLVEDDDAVRGVVCRMLTSQGFGVIEARGGSEALEKLQAHDGSVHAVLTDVVMPRGSGPELADEIHKLRPNLPLAFMSAHTDETLSMQGVRHERRFLKKPFTEDALVEVMQELLYGFKAAPPSQGP